MGYLIALALLLWAAYSVCFLLVSRQKAPYNDQRLNEFHQSEMTQRYLRRKRIWIVIQTIAIVISAFMSVVYLT